MPAVMLNPGKYFVGDPKRFIDNWKPSESGLYKCGPYSYFAFRYNGTWIAAVPADALEYIEKPNLDFGQFMKFEKETLFFMQNGCGHIDGIELGVLGKSPELTVTAPIVVETGTLRIKKAKLV